jgi:uncharacterized protein (DUF305 family)
MRIGRLALAFPLALPLAFPLALAIAFAPGPAAAQDMQGMKMGEGDADKALMKAMQEGMEAPMSGDADRDFAGMMIPHHQGAIDMAKAELQFGKDATLRKLAKAIVGAQEKEIALMKRWQEKHAK